MFPPHLWPRMPADVAVDASAGDGESAERRGWRRSSGNNSAEEQVCCSGKRDEGERQRRRERAGVRVKGVG